MNFRGVLLGMVVCVECVCGMRGGGMQGGLGHTGVCSVCVVWRDDGV